MAKEELVETVSKSEQFYNRYKKTIWFVIGAVVVVGLLTLAYIKFIYQPKCVEAQGQMYPAEEAFAKGEYELALNGDGNVLGFAQIIEDYGTKAGKSVYMYAGVAEYQLGNYEQAVAYLKKYKGKDAILAARAKACMGDAYVALGEDSYADALKCYKEAVATADNMFTAAYLLKEGVTLEAMGRNQEALECYKSIKENYAMSVEAYDVDKYIARVTVATEE